MWRDWYLCSVLLCLYHNPLGKNYPDKIARSEIELSSQRIKRPAVRGGALIVRELLWAGKEDSHQADSNPCEQTVCYERDQIVQFERQILELGRTR